MPRVSTRRQLQPSPTVLHVSMNLALRPLGRALREVGSRNPRAHDSRGSCAEVSPF